MGADFEFDMTGMGWQERLPHLIQIDFSREELNQIGADAALDLLTSSQLRTLVMLFAQVRIV